MSRRQSRFHRRAIHVLRKIFSVGVSITSVDVVVNVSVTSRAGVSVQRHALEVVHGAGGEHLTCYLALTPGKQAAMLIATRGLERQVDTRLS